MPSVTKKTKSDSLASNFKKKVKQPPLWKGPYEDGITQTLLSRFIVCKERFRLLVMEGLKPTEGFEPRLEYGNLWHVCEEYYANGRDWQNPLFVYCQTLCRRFPTQQEQIDHWYNVCKCQFPIYIDYWKKHGPKNQTVEPLYQEQVFKYPYLLRGSGRIVKLLGKFDSIDLVTKNKKKAVWLQENKSKGDINERELQQRLTFDMQTMIYRIAMDQLDLPAPIAGVRYNVIRRPLSGGRGTIKRHQPSKSNPEGESKDAFYKRLVDDYMAKEPEYYFMRWDVDITQHDIEIFEATFLQPCLESLCDWWDWITTREGFNRYHWRLPYGVYLGAIEGKPTELDEYLKTGNMLGLTRTKELFPELS